MQLLFGQLVLLFNPTTGHTDHDFGQETHQRCGQERLRVKVSEDLDHDMGTSGTNEPVQDVMTPDPAACSEIETESEIDKERTIMVYL